MKKIALTQGKYALVDDDDFDTLSNHKWYAEVDIRNAYALREWRSDGRRGSVYMHHEVVGFPKKGNVVDHINGDGLDNRKENLRIVSHRENIGNNKRKRLGLAKSKYVGVTLEKKNLKKPWKAQARINGISKHIGLFSTEEEASLAYSSFIENKVPKETK